MGYLSIKDLGADIPSLLGASICQSTSLFPAPFTDSNAIGMAMARTHVLANLSVDLLGDLTTPNSSQPVPLCINYNSPQP